VSGAAVFPVIDWLAFLSVQVMTGVDPAAAGPDVWSSQVSWQQQQCRQPQALSR
jgi:hypothetical protein